MSPRMVVHIDTNGDLNYLSDGGEVEPPATKLHLLKSEKQSRCAVIGCHEVATAVNNEGEPLCADCLKDWNAEHAQ